MKENAGFFTSWLKQIFLIHAHISYQPIKMRVWQHITNQNSRDVTAVLIYSHLNTGIDQWKCAYYPYFFINNNNKNNNNNYHSMYFSFFFIGRELTTWPANNCLQISVLLQIIFCSCVIEPTLSCENGSSPSWAFRKRFNCWELWEIKLNESSHDKTIIELGYRNISIVICQCLAHPLFASAFGFGK